MNVTITIPSLYENHPVLIDQSGAPFIGGSGANNISGIILSIEGTDESGITTMLFPTGDTILSYMYKDPNLSAMSSNDIGTIDIWYTNLNNAKQNIGSAQFPPFQ
jgi:hypothetical protein